MASRVAPIQRGRSERRGGQQVPLYHDEPTVTPTATAASPPRDDVLGYRPDHGREPPDETHPADVAMPLTDIGLSNVL
jgi:hypothetical protein